MSAPTAPEQTPTVPIPAPPAEVPDNLPFKVVPEFLEDLGVNLYTSLDKVLVEFVANAHDADATFAKISLDVAEIDAARRALKSEWEANRERVRAKNKDAVVPPLEAQTLEGKYTITVEDDGYGMGLDDLRDKFLQVSRRKREDEGLRSPKKRVFMGRKGLGKLAGFGVAQKIVVTSQKEGEAHATRITLDYVEIRKFKSMNEVIVPCERLPAGGNFVSNKGTRVELSRLVYSGLKGTQNTALRHVADCFWMVDINDFALWHGDQLLQATQRTFEFAYPPVAGDSKEALATRDVELAGTTHTLRYRIRFTPPKGQLLSHEHGVRIYAHSRLASVPYLFEVPSSSTGYKYTSYLDGVVVADFVDEQGTDYIATNRQTLRWETPLLIDLHKFIHDEIRTALKAYYDTKEDTITKIVEQDLWTKQTIDAANLPKHREKLAYRMAVVLAKADPDEVESKFYKKSLPIMATGLSRGDVLTAIADLAKEAAPDLDSVVREVSELTRQEFGDFLSIVQGRLDGIIALRKINKDQSFKGPDREKELQELLETCPWLIDPTFFQFLTGDETQETLNERLGKQLCVGKHVPADYKKDDLEETKKFGHNKRPDLTFLLNNEALRRVIIVELKAPNTPLHSDHLQQLKDYLRRTEEFLEAKYPSQKFIMRGLLIGSRAAPEDSGQEKVKQLRYEEKKRPQDAVWEVLDLAEVLERTEAAHKHIIDCYEAARKREKAAEAKAKAGS